MSLPQECHTVMLVQASDVGSRQYADYDTVEEALDGICQMYELHLKKTNPKGSEISYDLVQLFDYIDQLTDMSFLVWQRVTHSYAPFTREWIKERIYMKLRQDNLREQQLANGDCNGQQVMDNGH